MPFFVFLSDVLFVVLVVLSALSAWCCFHFRFVESMCTQTIVVFCIRSDKIVFLDRSGMVIPTERDQNDELKRKAY